MNKQDTAEMLAYLAAAYPTAHITRETAQIYHDVLGNIHRDLVMDACRNLVRENAFFPSSAEILRKVGNMQGMLSPLAGVAWETVQNEIRRVGHITQPEFMDDTVAAAVKAIGWRELCLADNQGVVRSNFLKVYAELAQQHDKARLERLSEMRPEIGAGGGGELEEAAEE